MHKSTAQGSPVTKSHVHDPKYQFGSEDAVYHRDGEYFLPDDEPLVLFRGKDVGTLVALDAYRKFMEHVSAHAETAHARIVARAHADSIAERLVAISAFQADNPDRTGLGCHTCLPGIGPHDIAGHIHTYVDETSDEKEAH
jgi:hypothetical protein